MKNIKVIELVQGALAARKAEIDEFCVDREFYAKPKNLPKVAIYKAQSRAITQLARSNGESVDIMIHKLLCDALSSEQLGKYQTELREEAHEIIDERIEKSKK